MKPRSAWAERGQATLEYILILIIVIILILSLLYQFHDSFRKYAEAFFDGYVRCLLEVGELPGTGSICSQEFTAFDPKAGKSLLKNNIPDSASGGGAAAKKGGPPKVPTGSREAKGGVGGGGSAPVGRFNSEPRGGAISVGKLEGGQSKGERASLNGASNTIPVGRLRVQGSSQTSTFYTEESDASAVKDDHPKEPVATSKKVVGGDGLRPSKVVEELQRKPAASVDGDSGFTVGGLVRLLLIILIIVAMVIFFGGQLLQISRSRDKSGD